MIARIVALACLVGCLEAELQVCASGRICPRQTVCHDPSDRCVRPEQLEACAGAAEGASCTVAGASGTCLGGLCEVLVCGDGIVSGAEACDGTQVTTCAALALHERAGTPVACGASCTWDVSGCDGGCGDEEVNGPEVCELGQILGLCAHAGGFDAGVLECSAACEESTAGCARFTWREIPLGPTPLVAVWADAQGFLAVNHDGVVRQSSGLSSGVWQAFASPTTEKTPSALWGSSRADLWMGFRGGPLAYYDGTSWRDVAEPFQEVRGLWGFSTTEVYAVGGTFVSGGQIARLEDGVWQPMTVPATPRLNAVWGAASDDVYAVGAAGTLVHFDGSEWSAVDAPATSSAHHAVWGSSATDVWVVGGQAGALPSGHIYHYDGLEWTQTRALDTPLYAVHGRGPRDVFAAGGLYPGRGGYVLHFDGSGWSDVSPSTSADQLGIASSGDAVVSIGDDGAVQTWSGQLRASEPLPSYPGVLDFYPYDLWTGRGVEVALLGGNSTDFAGSLHLRDGVWTPYLAGGLRLYAPFGDEIDDLHALTVGNIAGTDSGVVHFDGSAWSDAGNFPGVVLLDLWRSPAGELWVVGADGAAFRKDAGSWVDVGADTSEDLNHVWGSGDGDLFATSQEGRLYRWDGAAWAATAFAVDGRLSAIWGSSAADLWIVQAPDVLWHFDGVAFTERTRLSAELGYSVALEALDGTAADDVFAVGPGGTFHFDGRSWAPINLGDAGSLSASPTVVAVLSGSGVTRLIRTRLWRCRPAETTCADAVDDDCDGLMDELDPDCN